MFCTIIAKRINSLCKPKPDNGLWYFKCCFKQHEHKNENSKKNYALTECALSPDYSIS